MASGDRAFAMGIAILCVVSGAIVLWLLVDGWSFYSTSLVDRPHHPLYRDVHPGGFRGHGLGMLGSGMILLLLLYSVRKRSRRLARFGSMAKWLRVHIYFGIFGPILITLHTTLKIEGLVAVSYWSMVAVALSGIFGRYLYQQIPRTILGNAMTPTEIRTETERINRRLRDEYHLADGDLAAVDRLVGTSGDGGRWAAIASLVAGNLTLRRRSAALIHRLRDSLDVPSSKLPKLRATIWKRCLLQRRLRLLGHVQELFHWWHVIHKPFAYLMLFIMFVHVGVAVLFGYTWIF